MRLLLFAISLIITIIFLIILLEIERRNKKSYMKLAKDLEDRLQEYEFEAISNRNIIENLNKEVNILKEEKENLIIVINEDKYNKKKSSKGKRKNF